MYVYSIIVTHVYYSTLYISLYNKNRRWPNKSLLHQYPNEKYSVMRVGVLLPQAGSSVRKKQQVKFRIEQGENNTTATT